MIDKGFKKTLIYTLIFGLICAIVMFILFLCNSVCFYHQSTAATMKVNGYGSHTTVGGSVYYDIFEVQPFLGVLIIIFFALAFIMGIIAIIQIAKGKKSKGRRIFYYVMCILAVFVAAYISISTNNVGSHSSSSYGNSVGSYTTSTHVGLVGEGIAVCALLYLQAGTYLVFAIMDPK